MVDGQMQCHHGVTTRNIGQCEGRSVRGFGIGLAVNPSEAVTGHLFVNAGVGVVDGEVQRHNRVATMNRLVSIGRGDGRS